MAPNVKDPKVDLSDLIERARSRPDIDHRSADEILGYDAQQPTGHSADMWASSGAGLDVACDH